MLPAPQLLLIEQDLPCIACRYNLKTVPLEGRCPECGATVADTFRAYANRLAGANPQWLRTITSGLLWLVLAMLIPILFIFIPLPKTSVNSWLTTNRLQLTIVLTPAILAIVACWRLGTAQPDLDSANAQANQPITRWALRITALAWLIPLIFYAGPLAQTVYDIDPSRPYLTLTFLSCSAIPASLLLFRRLDYLACAIPARLLQYQCKFIAAQLPVALILLAILARWILRRDDDVVPDAFRYAVMTPLPGAGLPWPLVFSVERLQWINRNQLADPEYLIVEWPVFINIALFLIALQFLVALIRVRRSGRARSDYSKAALLNLSRASPEPAPA